MTLYGWMIREDNYFDFVAYSLTDFPKWRSWEKQLNDVLADMDYEDAKGLDFEGLISLAGLTGEIELAMKERDMNKRINDLQKDF